MKEGRSVVRFGVFELDVSAGELRKQGRKINLQQQPFQVLALLLRRPGELVTREELQQELWPADTFVEFDQGLNTAIKKIRQALDDSADHPRFVETLPRKGYRFIAAVNEIDGSPESSTHATVLTRRLLPIAAGLGLAVVAATAWLLNQDTQKSMALVAVPLTTDPGVESRPSFSPDGSQVAFDYWDLQKGQFEIRVKRIGGSEQARLADGCCPAWSPDGRSIAFFGISDPTQSFAPGTSPVFRVSPLGGPPRKLADLHVEEWGRGLAWHPSGKWLIVPDRDFPTQPIALFALSVDSGQKGRLTSPAGGRGDVLPAVSPDGEVLVFGRCAAASLCDLNLIELSGECEPKGEVKRLTSENTYNNYAAWTPDSRAIVFRSGTANFPALYELRLLRPGWRPGEATRLAFAGDGVRSPAISRQGRLAYATSDFGADIWRLELNGAGQAGAPPEALITSTRLDHVPQYSPDGTRIAFASNRSGSHEIWVCNSDGSGTKQLTSMGGSLYTVEPHWSPDGRLILFCSNPEGRRDHYVIDANGGTPKLLFENVGVSLGARIGESIYLDREGQVWRSHWPPLRKDVDAIQITRGGGASAQESPDGKTLYYAKDDEEIASLWKVPVDGGEESQVLESVYCRNFVVAKDGIYFIPDWAPGRMPSVQFLSFATGNVAEVVRLSGLPACGFALSSDGRALLYSQFQPVQSDLWLVENFR